MEELNTILGGLTVTLSGTQEPVASESKLLPERLSDEEVLNTAFPVVARVLRRKLKQAGVGAGPLPAILEELVQETGLRIFRYTQGRFVLSTEALAVSVATSVFVDYVRQKAPEFYNLRRRLQLLLKREEEYVCWTDNRGYEICGLRQWQGQNPIKLRPSLRLNLARLLQPLFNQPGNISPSRLLTEIFKATQGPVRVLDVLDLAKDTLAHPDNLSLEALTETDSFYPVAATESPEDSLASTETLESYWKVIRELKRPQACALLLGSSELRQLLIERQVATIAQVAEVINMPVEQIWKCWEHSLSDKTIAAFLECADINEVFYQRRLARDLLRRRIKQ